MFECCLCFDIDLVFVELDTTAIFGACIGAIYVYTLICLGEATATSLFGSVAKR